MLNFTFSLKQIKKYHVLPLWALVLTLGASWEYKLKFPILKEVVFWLFVFDMYRSKCIVGHLNLNLVWFNKITPQVTQSTFFQLLAIADFSRVLRAKCNVCKTRLKCPLGVKLPNSHRCFNAVLRKLRSFELK